MCQYYLEIIDRYGRARFFANYKNLRVNTAWCKAGGYSFYFRDHQKTVDAKWLEGLLTRMGRKFRWVNDEILEHEENILFYREFLKGLENDLENEKRRLDRVPVGDEDLPF